MSRETLCRRIVGNLRDLESELKALRTQAAGVRDEVRLPNARRSDEIEESSGTGFPGRRPSRGGRVGIALDIISALGQVLANDNSDVIRDLERDIVELERQLDAINKTIREKEKLVRDQQDEFNRHDCFGMGFSHEVLNIRSADQVLYA